MRLKIKGRNPQRFKQNLTAVLNMATVIVQGGHIPTQQEQDEPDRLGRYWYAEDGGHQRIHLAGAANDYWANVREQKENEIVIEFSCRYDRDNVKRDALTKLMPAFLGADIAEII